MKEWIVCADSPTRAMERMRTGEVVRCRDCEHYLDGDCLLLHIAMPDMDGGFCAWGERGE